MSVVDIKESWRSTPWNSTSPPGEPFSSRIFAVRQLTVTTDDPTDSPVVVGDAIGINTGDPHPQQPTLFMTDIHFEKITPTFHKVTYTYTSVSSSDQTRRLPVISWDTVESQEAIDIDAFGTPIMTVNGESYDPPLTRPFADQTLQINRNESFYPTALIADYINTVNDDIFWGYPPGTVLFKRAPATTITKTWQVYVNLTYSFQIRTDGWLARILHRGTIVRVLGSSPARYRKLKDADGSDRTDPVLLDENGFEITLDEFGTPKTPIHFQYFHRYDIRQFAAFGLT